MMTRLEPFTGARIFLVSLGLAMAGVFPAPSVLVGQVQINADQQALDAFNKGDYDTAVACATLAIHLNPKDAKGYYQRGIAYQVQGDNDKAIEDLDRAIQLDPKYSNSYYWRGDAYQAKGDNDKAIADFNLAIQGDSEFPLHCLIDRGIAYSATGNYGKAIEDFSHAIQLKPEYMDSYIKSAYNNLAWLLATCPQPHFRDGKQAVGYATKACELTHWKDPSTLDTLAAAYAEAGDFDHAVKWETQFLALADLSAKDEADGKIRLALYQGRKPYHEANWNKADGHP